MGNFDFYCKICGLPFRPIDGRETETNWLNNATLLGFGENIDLESRENSGNFYLKNTISTKLIKKFKTLEAIDEDNTISVFTILDKNKKCSLCHKACEHRRDASKVKKDLSKMKSFHAQYFEDEEFLENDALLYLLEEPKQIVTKTPTPPSSPEVKMVKKVKKVSKKKKDMKQKTIEDLSVKNLHEICDKLSIRKAKIKADIVGDIRDFICSR